MHPPSKSVKFGHHFIRTKWSQHLPTYRLCFVRSPRYIVQTVNHWIHTGIRAREQEQSFLDFLINFECRVSVQPIPHAHRIEWCPAYDEHNHNRYCHAKSLSFRTTQVIVIRSAQTICIESKENLVPMEFVAKESMSHLLHISCSSYTARCRWTHNRR